MRSDRVAPPVDEASVQSPPSTAAEEQAAAIISAVIGQLFSTRRPRDVCAGVSSALKSVAKGCALGVAALIAAPVAGAITDGGKDEPVEEGAAPVAKKSRAMARVRCVCAGFGAGLAAAVLLPLTGAIVGLVQICRGAWNTPSALYHGCGGGGDLEWDTEKRVWREHEVYSLPAEAASVEAESAAEGPSGARRVASLEYYDLLKVSSSAGAAEIKKGYYKQARECHPDKCVGDEEASTRFQALSHAYQVLSDTQLRAAYDRDGAIATADVSFEYDPAVFFAALFGSERFDAFVGQLALAQLSSTLTKRGGAAEAAQSAILQQQRGSEGSETGESHLSNAIAQAAQEGCSQFKAKQHGREVRLAVALAESLSPYVRGDVDQFARWAKSESCALALADAPSTLTKGQLLDALAREYGLAADEWFGTHDSLLGMGGTIAHARASAARTVAMASAAQGGARALYEVKKLSNFPQPSDLDEEEEEKEDSEDFDETVQPAAATRSQLAALKVGELKRLALRHNVSLQGCVEKEHVICALLAAKVPQPTADCADPSASANGKQPQPPATAKPAKKPKKEELSAAAAAKKKDAPTAEEAMRNSMPVFLDAMVRVSLVDVHKTLTKVCEKVLLDESVSLEVRRKRAEGLRILSKTLLAAGKEQREASSRATAAIDAETNAAASPGTAAAKRFEHAMNVTMAAAMGQEISEPNGPEIPLT